MSKAKAQLVGSVVAGFPSPAEQYVEPMSSLYIFRIQSDRIGGTFA